MSSLPLEQWIIMTSVIKMAAEFEHLHYLFLTKSWNHCYYSPILHARQPRFRNKCKSINGWLGLPVCNHKWIISLFQNSYYGWGKVTDIIHGNWLFILKIGAVKYPQNLRSWSLSTFGNKPGILMEKSQKWFFWNRCTPSGLLLVHSVASYYSPYPNKLKSLYVYVWSLQLGPFISGST